MCRALLLTLLILCAPGLAAAQTPPGGGNVGGGVAMTDDQKIEKKWLDLWREMSQQETMSDQEATKAGAAGKDAVTANKIGDAVSRLQAENALQLTPTAAHCGISSSVLGQAAGEQAAEENRTELVAASAPQADATNRGDASRWCQYVGSLPIPALQKTCEQAGHKVLATPATSDVTQKAPGTLDVADGELSDADKALVGYVGLLLGDAQFTGLGIAARDPTRFAAVMDVRSSMATDSVIRTTLVRNMAARMQGDARGAAVTRARLRSLGYDDAKVTELIGTNPSYMTQLEAGTKLPYQDSNFYVGLQGMQETQLRALNAGIEAQSLTQWREIYTSITARELMLAQILEAKLRAKQPEIAAQLSSTKR